MRLRASVVVVIVGVLAATLAGCSADDGSSRVPTPSVSSTAVARADAGTTPTPSDDPTGPPPAAGTVVLETDLATADGSASIHLRVVATGNDDYVVQSSDYRSTLGIPLAVFFRQFDEHVGDHISEGVSFGYTNWGHPEAGPATPEQQFSLREAGDDPSFLRTAVLVSERADADPLWPVLAVAPLHWSAPDRHPGLRVVDHGPRGHASGSVDLEGGVPRWYHVADGDTPDAVAARFGVTTDDLDYLSARQAVEVASGLRSGETLNLDRTKR